MVSAFFFKFNLFPACPHEPTDEVFGSPSGRLWVFFSAMFPRFRKKSRTTEGITPSAPQAAALMWLVAPFDVALAFLVPLVRVSDDHVIDFLQRHAAFFIVLFFQASATPA